MVPISEPQPRYGKKAGFFFLENEVCTLFQFFAFTEIHSLLLAPAFPHITSSTFCMFKEAFQEKSGHS
jgi:hypothetical protein